MNGNLNFYSCTIVLKTLLYIALMTKAFSNVRCLYTKQFFSTTQAWLAW